MQKTKESRHAARLRQLGFKPYSELLSAQDMQDVDNAAVQAFGVNPSKLSRRERRKLEAQKILPGFCVVNDEGYIYTYAMDEMGIDWHAEGTVDLAPWGFYNNIEGYFDIAKKRKRLLN